MKPERKNIFETPEGYFEDLKSNLKKIPQNEGALKPVFVKKRWVKITSVAAAVALLLMIPFQKTSNPSTETFNLGRLSDEDLETYLELYLNDIQLSQLTAEAENVDIFETMTDESLYEYVDEHMDEFSISELEK